MAKVPVPERGQPIDVSYLSQLSSAINDLSDKVSSSTYNYTSIDTDAAGKQNIKTSESRVIGGIFRLDSFSTQQATSTQTFTYNWGTEFKYPPIVSATPVNRVSGGAGDQTSVVITSVTTSSVSGIVRFNVAGNNISVNIHLIMIGVPA